MQWIPRAVIGLAVGVLSVACSGPSPSMTRTAIVKDVTIADEISPQTVTAQPGDEIRWVNVRKAPVQLDMPMLQNRSLACQRGFTNWLGQIRESITLKQNETASLCFENQTVLNYAVRATTSSPGGRDVMSGSVSVVR